MKKGIIRLILIIVMIATILSSCGSRPEFRNTTIEFPAVTFEKTEYNADIFDIEPFALHLNIPIDWELITPESEGSVQCDLYSPVGIYKGGVLIGSVGYNTFVLYPEAGDNPVAVYNHLMLGSVVNWNVDYTPVTQEGDLTVATCKVARSQIESGMSNAEAPVKYNRGILAHDNGLLVYIGIEIAEDSITDEQLSTLAGSIVLEGN